MSDVQQFIQSLDVPDPPSTTRAMQAARVPDLGSDQHAVVIGAQMAEFSAEVPANLRPAISQGLLLGQLAADKAVGTTGNVQLWYETFGLVMRKIGWLMTDLDFQEQTSTDSGAELHKAIIPVIMAMLGPQAAVASIIMAVLKGMEDMQKDTPWLTLFQRKSQSFHGAKFQMSYVDAGPSGGATLKAVYFGIDAQQAVTQVLFFKVATQATTLRNASTKMSLGASEIEQLAGPLRDKVLPFIAENIRDIEV